MLYHSLHTRVYCLIIVISCYYHIGLFGYADIMYCVMADHCMASSVAAAAAAVTSSVASHSNVLLALGSNIGRSSLTLSRAVQSLRSLPNTTLVSTSHLYNTPPAYVMDQPSFMNAACHIRTSLSPNDLLTRIKDLERDAGRDLVNGPRNGPRPLDIDIISIPPIIHDNDPFSATTSCGAIQ